MSERNPKAHEGQAGRSGWRKTILSMGNAALVTLALAPAVLCAAPDTIFIDSFEQTKAYDVAFTPNTAISGTVLLGNINVSAGSYVAFVRVQIFTDSTAPGDSFRLDCTLSPGFDSGIYSVGAETSVERYLTFQGAATLANPGNIQFSCRDGNGHIDTLLSGKLTVLSVSAVN